jgi:hypothetical protein
MQISQYHSFDHIMVLLMYALWSNTGVLVMPCQMSIGIGSHDLSERFPGCQVRAATPLNQQRAL